MAVRMLGRPGQRIDSPLCRHIASHPLIEWSIFNQHCQRRFVDELTVQLHTFTPSGFCPKEATSNLGDSRRARQPVAGDTTLQD